MQFAHLYLHAINNVLTVVRLRNIVHSLITKAQRVFLNKKSRFKGVLFLYNGMQTVFSSTQCKKVSVLIMKFLMKWARKK